MIKINNEHHTLHIGDVGINASIVSSYEKDKNRGMATYAKYFLEELTKLKPFEVLVKTDEKEILPHIITKAKEAVMTILCKGTKEGMNQFHDKRLIISS